MTILLLVIATNLSCRKQKVEYTDTFSLNSAAGHNYQISVLARSGPGTRYLFYVLDPKDLMPLVQKAVNSLPSDRHLTFVGVGYEGKNQRNRDFTFEQSVDGTGGGKQFADFIALDLDSVIVSKGLADVGTRRGIIGHSLGGLWGAYCFIGYATFFNDFLLLSPALFDADYHLFGYEKEHRDSVSHLSRSVYLGIGNGEDLGMRNGFEAFKDILVSHYPSVSLKTHVVAGSHYGSREKNIEEGLIHLLR